MLIKEFLLLLVGAVYGFLLWIIYLLIARPLSFVECFLRRRYRSWGISLSVDDEGKLRRRARVVGVLLLIVVAVHGTFVIGALLRCAGRWPNPPQHQLR